MSRAITLLRNGVASRKVAITLLALGLIVPSVSSYCAGQVAGQVKFVNSCQYSLTFNSTGPNIGTLAPGGQQSIALSSFHQGGQNRIIAYPKLTDNQCPNCDGWTDLGGPPGTTQREGWMWEGSDAKYAAYCNPSLSVRGICAQQHNCCGAHMVQDGTFGTHFEFTPKGTPSNDFVNLSTNYGSGPHSPPKLCGSQEATLTIAWTRRPLSSITCRSNGRRTSIVLSPRKARRSRVESASQRAVRTPISTRPTINKWRVR